MMIFERQGSHPNLSLFAAVEDSFGQPWRSLAAAREHLKRRKKAPTRFYKKREHTAEGFEVYRVVLLCPSSRSLLFKQDLIFPSWKDLLDHANKVYKGM